MFGSLPKIETWAVCKIWLTVLLYLMVYSSPMALAADYYVATNGSNLNPGTIAQPWRHICYATGADGRSGTYTTDPKVDQVACATTNPSKLTAGDTLYVRGGTYSEFYITFANSGTAGNPITIKAYPGETPIIDGGWTDYLGDGVRRDGSGYLPTFHIDNRHNITLDGLTIKRGIGANVRIGFNFPTSNITVRNGELQDFLVADNSGEVIILDLTENILIENNKLHGRIGNGGGTGLNAAGIHIFYAGTLTIRNNEIYDTNHGIYYKGSVINGKATTIENNLIYNQYRAGILINKQDAVMRNNIIRNVNPGAGIAVFEESSICDRLASDHNQILHNTIVDVTAGIVLNKIVGSHSCVGAVYTTIRNNLIYNFTKAEYRGLAIWPEYTSGSPDESYTTESHNLMYSSLTPNPIRLLKLYYSELTRPATILGDKTTSIEVAPIFQDYAGRNFTLVTGSPGKNSASDGRDMGANVCQVGVTPSCLFPSAPRNVRILP